MTSTVTTTVNLSMIGLQRFKGFKQRNPWPDPERSIGANWSSMGKNCCWEAIGPAQETVGKVLANIKDILESQHEYLNEGVCIRRVLLFDLYMVGRSEAQARPTIIFSCENKIQRQRAMKVIRESAILDGHPGVCLGESSRPPRLSSEPQQLGSTNLPNERSDGNATNTQRPAEAPARSAIQAEARESSSSSSRFAARLPLGNPECSKDVEMSDDTDASRAFDKAIYCNLPLSSVYGISIMIKSAKESKAHAFRNATVGGFIYVGDQLFCLTVAHVFLDNLQGNEERASEDVEFSFEYDEDEDEDNDEDENFINMTSRGSVSPNQSIIDESTSTDGAERSSPETALRNFPFLTFNRPGPTTLATEESNLSSLGRLAALSECSRTSNLDWALIRINSPLNSLICQQPGNFCTRSVAQDPPGKVKIKVLTATDHTIQGTIIGCSTFMQLPNSIAFQEMWSVQLDGPLKHGDCGSWVVDFDSGKLYGYITAGDPGTSIAYIIPAYQAFCDIEQRLNDKVTLPSFETIFSVPRVPTHVKKRADDAHLPKGDCRYILLHPEFKGLRCACTGFMWNRSTPGSTCDCGHQACYHVPEKDTNTSITKHEFNALIDRIALLEDELRKERHTSQGGLIDSPSPLKQLVDDTKEETDKEFRNIYRGIGGLWQNIGTLNKRAPYYDDHIEGLIDDVQGMRNRLIEIDDASMRLEDRVDVLETSSTAKGSFASQRATTDKVEASNPTHSRGQIPLDTVPEHVRLFKERIASVGTESGAWTVHVSLLPTASQPFPFEKDTKAYKRCLSRGLHRVIAIPSTDHDSFTAAVNDAFSGILRGRPWQPLVARTCDAKILRGLPMLRQLPVRLFSGRYDAEFLQKNCAVTNEEGKIIDIYIAMVDDSISWAEMKAMAPFLEGLESSWTYDQYLDGPYGEGGDLNLGSPIANKLHAAGDIVPTWSPSLKRKESEISRTPSFSSSPQRQRSPTAIGGRKRRVETQQRYIV